MLFRKFASTIRQLSKNFSSPFFRTKMVNHRSMHEAFCQIKFNQATTKGPSNLDCIITHPFEPEHSIHNRATGNRLCGVQNVRKKKIGLEIHLEEAGSLNRMCVNRKARELFPSLSGEMPTISPFHEHDTLHKI